VDGRGDGKTVSDRNSNGMSNGYGRRDNDQVRRFVFEAVMNMSIFRKFITFFARLSIHSSLRNGYTLLVAQTV